MADRTRRARRRRAGPGVRSVELSESELADDVRRRLRARTAAAGWVPRAPRDPHFDSLEADDSRDQVGDDETVPVEIPEEMGTASSVGRLRSALHDHAPFGLRGADVVPSRAAVAGLAGLLAAALALVLVLTWLQRPSESAVPSVRRSVPAGGGVSLPPSAAPSPDVVVHVIGAVRRPGLVELPGGSRVDDAVAAAGGARRKADLASVNLARVLVDGEQIAVGRTGEAPPATTGGSTAGTAAPGQPVDLNTATLEQLDGLPGVGPVLAQRILDWRTAHGRFSSVDELTEVSGIGERTFADLRPLVRL